MFLSIFFCIHKWTYHFNQNSNIQFGQCKERGQIKWNLVCVCVIVFSFVCCFILLLLNFVVIVGELVLCRFSWVLVIFFIWCMNVYLTLVWSPFARWSREEKKNYRNWCGRISHRIFLSIIYKMKSIKKQTLSPLLQFYIRFFCRRMRRKSFKYQKKNKIFCWWISNGYMAIVTQSILRHTTHISNAYKIRTTHTHLHCK